MARNDSRRSELADAGIRVLAREGSRGLTHRAVDREAGVPLGTASNYFRTRQALTDGLHGRILQRLTPEAAVLARLAAGPATRELFGTYIRDIVRRLMASPDVTLALFELRLDAARRPETATGLTRGLRDAYRADVAFTAERGLPAGAFEIALFHYAVDGLVLDQLTVPLDDEIDTDRVVDALVDRLLPG